MQTMLSLTNVGLDVPNEDCAKANPGEDMWKCMFAEHLIDHVKTPIFSIQSFYDNWEIGNVLDLPCF